ncbi:MAG: ion transporter [Bacteroidales bacterium]|nr:ion transporter [Bacteroidales bacterium]
MEEQKRKKRFWTRWKEIFIEKFWRNQPLKDKLYEITFGSETKAGKMFDIVLMIMIVASIVVLMIESAGIPRAFKITFIVFEYIFTAFFTFEYLARVYCSPKPLKYIFSFYGIIDLISTLPVYISFFFGGARYFLIIRTFRLIRIFRVFKLFNFLQEGQFLILALRDSSKKIIVFFLFVLILVISMGTIMYMIEGGKNSENFNNIFTSIYWAIVTMTTVGYGDITPTTPMGRFLSAFVMLLGYTIIAVPTGIVSASMAKSYKKQREKFRICPRCHEYEYDNEAKFCKHCGHEFGDDWRQEHPEERIVRTDGKPEPVETEEYEEPV